MREALLRFSAALCAFLLGAGTAGVWNRWTGESSTRHSGMGTLCHTSAANSPSIVNGRAISLPQPVYPPAAKAALASGAVNVQIIVDEEGKVISARAVSGHPLLRQAAEEAALRARFTPTRVDGKPVKVNGTIAYNFALL